MLQLNHHVCSSVYRSARSWVRWSAENMVYYKNCSSAKFLQLYLLYIILLAASLWYTFTLLSYRQCSCTVMVRVIISISHWKYVQLRRGNNQNHRASMYKERSEGLGRCYIELLGVNRSYLSLVTWLVQAAAGQSEIKKKWQNCVAGDILSAYIMASSIHLYVD